MKLLLDVCEKLREKPESERGRGGRCQLLSLVRVLHSRLLTPEEPLEEDNGRHDEGHPEHAEGVFASQETAVEEA